MMLYLRAALIGAVVCYLAETTTAKSSKVNILERELIEVLVGYAKEKGEKAITEKKKQRKHFFDIGVDKKNKGTSARQLQQLKMSTPETRVQENYAIEALAATKELESLTGMSLQEIQNSDEVLAEWRRIVPCPSALTVSGCGTASSQYRTITGKCNNLQQPDWGSAGISQRRYLTAKYNDGIDSPRSASSRDSSQLPSARRVSNVLFVNTSTEVRETEISLMVMAWGQFLDHDITLTPEAPGEEGAHIDCCDETASERDECFPITIPRNDKHFTTTCMSFTRSSAAVESCDPGMRQQTNAITAFVDGSNVYGSSDEEVTALRSFSKGMLLSSSGNLPPSGSEDSCIASSPNDFCIKVGDVRANVVPHLGANHVLFFREHNRIAQELSTLNPKWNDERTFQETRKIVSALLQQITYYEWLPSVLAPEFLDTYNLKQSAGDPYDVNVDPSIKNSFAVAAMRYGHSLVTGFQAFLLHDYMTYTVKPIEETFFSPTMVVGSGGNDVPLLARWVCANESMKRDRIFERGIRDLLFLDSDGHSFDLGALNIQRGRDHGVPSYNDWRVWVGLPKAKTFSDLTDHSDRDIRLLEKAYSHVDDIDLFAGGISEKDITGGHLGRVFSHILARQFSELKAGDRFFFERPSSKTEGFTDGQLAEIKKVKLSKVMCENFGLDLIPGNVFKLTGDNKTKRSCESLSGMDLSKWASGNDRSGTGNNNGGSSGNQNGNNNRRPPPN